MVCATHATFTDTLKVQGAQNENVRFFIFDKKSLNFSSSQVRYKLSKTVYLIIIHTNLKIVKLYDCINGILKYQKKWPPESLIHNKICKII